MIVFQKSARYQNRNQSTNVWSKGRSSLKQYMPMKPVKRGYKIWARADALTGYLYEFEVYSGKTERVVEVSLGPNIVFRLSEAIKHNGCHVTFDIFLHQ